MNGNFGDRLRKDWVRNRSLYFLVIPVLIFYLLFHYKPMYGAVIAFKDYTPALGVADSPWVGFANFARFFRSVYFGRLIKNTILLSVYNLIFGFPAPIILALLLNEVRNKQFKSITQTITYLPHFISLIVATGMLTNFSMTTGLFNDIIAFFGGGAFTAPPGSKALPYHLCGFVHLAGSGLGIHHLPFCTGRCGQPALRGGTDRRRREVETADPCDDACHCADDHHYADHEDGITDEYGI